MERSSAARNLYRFASSAMLGGLLLAGGAVLAQAPQELQPVAIPIQLAGVGSATDSIQHFSAEIHSPAMVPMSVARPESRFYSGHFIPKVSERFERVAPLIDRYDSAFAFADHAFHDTIQADASDMMRSATQKAVRDFLLEETFLARWTQVELPRVGGEGTPGSKRRGIRPTVDLRLSQRESRIAIGYRYTNGSLRFSFGTRGSLGVRFKNTSLGRTVLSARYRPDRDWVGLHCNIAF